MQAESKKKEAAELLRQQQLEKRAAVAVAGGGTTVATSSTSASSALKTIGRTSVDGKARAASVDKDKLGITAGQATSTTATITLTAPTTIITTDTTYKVGDFPAIYIHIKYDVYATESCMYSITISIVILHILN